MKPKFNQIGLAFTVLVLFTLSAFAQTNSVPVVAPVAATPWWIDLLAFSATVVTAIIAWGAKVLIAKMKLNEAQAAAMDACTAAVSQTYVDYVRALKAAGKFGPTEKALAREKAITLAKDLATGPAKDLLISYGSEHIGAWIEAIVTKLKGGTKLENGVTPPAK